MSLEFESFYNGWVIRQQYFLDQLLQAMEPHNVRNTEQQRTLIEQVVWHYQQYFEVKFEAVKKEVFVFFYPPWINSFEKPLLWIGGLRPSLVFKLLESAVADLTSEQKQRIERTKYETRREERELTEEMARLQESTATPAFLNLSRRFGRLINGEELELDSALETLKTGMRVALERADRLLASTTGRVIEILSPLQSVKLLAAIAQFHLEARRLGIQREQLREASR